MHSAAGLGLSRVAFGGQAGRALRLAAIACLPDLDLLPGVLQGDAFRYHHGLSHSLGAAFAVSLAPTVAGHGGLRVRVRFAAVVGLAYLSHLVLDLVTYDAFHGDGVGIPFFWPVSDARLLSTAHLLFFGIGPDATGLVDGVFRVANAWALVWEIGLLLLVVSLFSLRSPRAWIGELAGPMPGRSRVVAGSVVAAVLLLASCPHLGGNVLEDLRAAPEDVGMGPTNGSQPEPSLPAADPGDSSLADAPISEAARKWIRENHELIRDVGESLTISPVSLAGVVAAERSLLHDPFDSSVDALFGAYFATLTEGELRTWVARQEDGYQRQLKSGGDPGLRSFKNPYLWSVGPSQVSFRNAIFYEPRLAKLQRRSKRSLQEIVAALLSPRGSLEYAAVILLDAQEAYARYADLDLRSQPGVLATLYHLGSPARRAIRLGEENRTRELEGEPPAVPRMNFYGEFVDRHTAELEALLR
jgi:hypothetical protein